LVIWALFTKIIEDYLFKHLIGSLYSSSSTD
jgi:hypothetical protein